jgi:hypothetical protein
MKQLSLQLMGGALALAVAGLVGWAGWLHANHGSIDFQWGRLATANGQDVDGSNRWFRQDSYHLGKGTRTRGEVYRIKVGRVYVSLGVEHINPNVTPSEAEE